MHDELSMAKGVPQHLKRQAAIGALDPLQSFISAHDHILP